MNADKLTGGAFVARCLYAAGIRHVFSISGAQLLPIWDEFARCEGLTLVVPRNERSAAFMAEGYARARRAPALLMSTLGPGVANELVGLVSARASRAPVCAVAPCQPPWKRPRIAEVFQGLDHQRFFEGVVKWQRVADRADDIAALLPEALQMASSESQGPVRLDVSFPLLFERRRWKMPAAKAFTDGESSEPIVVIESEAAGDGLAADMCDRLRARRMAPGIDQPGFGLSLALGARLASVGAPVMAFTTVEALRDQLDVLATARALGVPPMLWQDGEGGPVSAIARAFSAGPVGDASDADILRTRIGETPAALHVVVSGRP